MRWLVTGGCGFIGSQLVRYLCSLDEDVVVLDNLTVGKADVIEGSSAELVHGNVCDVQLLEGLADTVDTIVHLAAVSGVPISVKDPVACFDNNARGTFDCLEAARRTKCSLVFASSGAVGGQEGPASPYGASKATGENFCKAYATTYRLPVRVLRFSSVYGPGSMHKTSVVANFVRAALAGELLEIRGDGTQTRDFVYVGDVVRAIVRAATVVDAPGPFYVHTGYETSVLQIAERLSRVLGQEPKLQFVAAGQGELRHVSAFGPKLPGWKAVTRLGVGLEHTVAYFKEVFCG